MNEKKTEGYIQRHEEFVASRLAIKEYVITWTQISTDAPTVVELQNDLGGSPEWSRAGVGSYFGVLTGAFTDGKTVMPFGCFSYDNDEFGSAKAAMPLGAGNGSSDPTQVGWLVISNDTDAIYIECYNLIGVAAEYSTLVGRETIITLQLKVYP